MANFKYFMLASLLGLILSACFDEEKQIDDEHKYFFYLTPPTKVDSYIDFSKIEIDSNKLLVDIEVIDDTRELVMRATKYWEDLSIGYYKVIQINDSVWYMWYQAWETLQYQDYGSRFCFAYSNNGKDWIKKIPKKENLQNNIIIGEDRQRQQGWVEFDVFIDSNDSIHPFRALYNKKDENTQKTFMSKSKNGWEWENEQLIFNSMHDSQFSVYVLSNGNYKVILRMWDTFADMGCRIIGSAIISPDGKIVEPPKKILISNDLQFTHLYTNATTFVNDNNYIMFPTKFGNNDQFIINTAYYAEGKVELNSSDITFNLYQNDRVGWGNVCPGLIKTGEKGYYWMYYNRRIGSHKGDNYTTYYYRVKVRLKTQNKDNQICKNKKTFHTENKILQKKT